MAFKKCFEYQEFLYSLCDLCIDIKYELIIMQNYLCIMFIYGVIIVECILGKVKAIVSEWADVEVCSYRRIYYILVFIK